MPYTPQAWADYDVTKPASAARMTVIENGIATAQATAEAMLPKAGGTMDVAAAGPVNAFKVTTTSPFGTFDRFIVENNQDTQPVDIDFRNCTVDFGATSFAVSRVFAARFLQPAAGDGGYAVTNLLNVYKPGSNTQKVTYIGPNGGIHMGVGGLASLALSIYTDGDANNKFQITETGKHQWGPGGATAVDAHLERSATGTLKITGNLQIDGDLQVVKFASNLGFFNATAVGKQTISGSRGGNAALADLLTKLANYGLISDSTSA